MNIVKISNANTLEEYIENRSGKSIKELQDELKAGKNDYTISGVDEFKAIVDNHDTIAVCGDYDVDGDCATYLMVAMLKRLKKKVIYRFPKRISEGFGLSKAAVEDVAAQGATLVITVDNGITANEAVDRAKELGLTVIITDHHLPNEVLPAADLIIDPNAIENSATFNGYCGAGLVMKLIEQLIDTTAFLNAAYTVAAVATIADKVPIKEDNRRLTHLGLEQLRKGNGPVGLKKLIEVFGIDVKNISTDDIAFKIAPAINAPGRLFDDGAVIAFNTLASTSANAEANAKNLQNLNEQRKKLVDDALVRINEKLAKTGIKCPLIIEETVHEGVVGIVAGKLAEKYRIPAIMLTKTENGYKGSARAPKGFHMKDMLDKYADMLVNYGGHAAAAGLTVKAECLEDFIRSIQGEYADYKIPEKVIEYDLEIYEEDLSKIANDLKKYAPFGEDMPEPTFMVRAMTLVPDKDGALVKEIGKNSLRLNCKDKVNALALQQATRYDELGRPDRITAVGKVGFNYWNGWTFTQIILTAFDKAPDSYISLATLVKQRLAELRNQTSVPEEEPDFDSTTV